MSEKSENMKQGIGYKMLTSYIRLVYSKFYYKKVYWLNTENIPAAGPLMIVSDHQNGLSDVLGLLLSVQNRKKRKIRVLARADIFNSVFRKALEWLGLMPAFRMSFEGADSLSNNSEMFEKVEEELLNDGTVVIYPEAGHQDKRWLGQFSLAYLHILFKTAEKTNFEKEFFVLPSCNHYSDYFHAREEMLVSYGTPISLAPYYELYKTKPRTAQRQVNALVREQISSMMLNITDLENYEAIDFLRETYGIEYANRKYYNADELPEKLASDKLFFEELENAKENNESGIRKIYGDAILLKNGIEKFGIDDKYFDKQPEIAGLWLQAVVFVVLFPFFIFSCIPNILIYYAPRMMTSKVKDRFLHSGIDFGLTAVVSAPMIYLLTFILTWVLTKSVFPALIYLLFQPFLALFMYRYMKNWKRYKKQIRFYRLKKEEKLNELIQIRGNIYKSLDNILK